MSHQVNVDTAGPVTRDLGTLIIALRKDAKNGSQASVTNAASADGNYIYLTVDADGYLRASGRVNDAKEMLVADATMRSTLEEIAMSLRQLVAGMSLLVETDLTDGTA